GWRERGEASGSFDSRLRQGALQEHPGSSQDRRQAKQYTPISCSPRLGHDSTPEQYLGTDTLPAGVAPAEYTDLRDHRPVSSSFRNVRYHSTDANRADWCGFDPFHKPVSCATPSALQL